MTQGHLEVRNFSTINKSNTISKSFKRRAFAFFKDLRPQCSNEKMFIRHLFPNRLFYVIVPIKDMPACFTWPCLTIVDLQEHTAVIVLYLNWFYFSR